MNLRETTVILFLFSAASVPLRAAVALPPQDPKICSGFNEGEGRWGYEPVFSDRTKRECPPGFAVLAAALDYYRDGAAEAPRVKSNCCPLPAPDILTSTHRWVRTRCNDSEVVTGMCFMTETERCSEGILRCTAINKTRYELGPVLSGIHWGFGSRAAFPWRERRRIKRAEIPPALRYGASRRSKTEFANDGCVGDPPGSLLAGVEGDRCVHTEFRELRYSGLAGDPPKDSPVRILPECRRISSFVTEAPQCMNDSENQTSEQ